MKIKLTENITEVYELKLPSGSKKLKCYVEKELMSLHPGFDEYSLWDYKVLKNESLILAVVIDTSFYMEKCIEDRFSAFYINYGEKKISYFNRNKYGTNGKRKIPLEVLFVLFLCFLFILITSATFFIKSRRPVQNAITTSPSMEVEKNAVPYIFDVLTDIADLCDEFNLEVSIINYISVPNHRLTLSISNPNDENVANAFMKLPYIKNVELSKTVYHENIAFLTVSAETEMPQIYISTSAQRKSEDIQKYLIEPMREHNIQMRSFDFIDNLVALEFVIEKGNETWFSETLLSEIKKLHFLPVDFHFSLNNERTECVVELKLIDFDIEQDWVYSNKKIIVNNLLKLEEKKKSDQEKKAIYVEPSPKEVLVEEKLTKIGIVKEGDEYITFYHDENGKIVKRKE